MKFFKGYMPLKKGKINIPNCDVETAIATFHKGLLTNSDIYKELTKYTCHTMDDVLARAWAQIK